MGLGTGVIGGPGTGVIGGPYWSQCFGFESPMSCFKRICDESAECGNQMDCDPPCNECCADDLHQCSILCCCRPYRDSDQCQLCNPCILGGGGGNTFTYIPPIGVSGPPGNLYYYVSPEHVHNPEPSLKEVYPFIPGTLLPWCPGECPASNSTVFIECPQKCNSWKFGLPCDDEIAVQLEGWNLTELFSSSLVSGGIRLDTAVPRQRYTDLTEPNSDNKDIGSNPIRSLGPNGWFVANTRGMGSSLNLKEVANIDHLINPIKLEWRVPDSDSDPELAGDSEPGDYLQVAVGLSYGTIIHSNASYPLINKIAINTFDGATGLNEPDYSSLFFWPIPKHNNQIVNDDGLLLDNKKIRISARNYKSPYSTNEFNVPYYISSATTAAGDVFGTVWSNTRWNPYRSFGMNLYYLKDDPSSQLNGITWQLNGGTAQKQAYGIRPDLILWKFAHQLYPELFTIGHTGCEGFTYTNKQCEGREWFGFMGQTLMGECDSNQIPTSLYYKQISLSDDFALVTLAHYEPEYDPELLEINDLKIHKVGRQVWKNRREQARWLFMISTTNEYRTVPLQNTEKVIEHFILDPVNNEVPTRLLTFDGKDNIYHYGLNDNGNHIKIPDHDNDVCRFCTPPGGDQENNYIMNWMICGVSAAGFTSCFKEEIEFGASNHPIWNTKTDGRPDMPYVYVLDALAHAKTFDNDVESASWDWIDATTLKAVLSWTDSTHKITKKFVKLYEGELPLPCRCSGVLNHQVPATNPGTAVNFVTGVVQNVGASIMTGWDVRAYGESQTGIGLLAAQDTGIMRNPGAVPDGLPGGCGQCTLRSNLEVGTVVGPTAFWYGNPAGSVFIGNAVGQWPANSTGYFGLKFINEATGTTHIDTFHNGFVKMQIGANATDRKIVGYCYNEKPCAEITVNEDISTKSYDCNGPRIIKIGAVEEIVPSGSAGSTLDQKIEILTVGSECEESTDVTWSPCQVTGWGRSSHQAIYYMKTLPYVSWYEAKNNDLIANTYNTLAKTVQIIPRCSYCEWCSDTDVYQRIPVYKNVSNATIGDPIPVHYTSKQDATNRNFNRRFSYPSGYDYFQSEIYAIAEGNTYPFLIEDWLIDPTKTVILGSPYSDFSSSDASSKYTAQIPTIPYWLRNYWLPSWTPKYPVIGNNINLQKIMGNNINSKYVHTRIDNIYNDKMPYNCDTCQYDGTTGCCEKNGVCEEGVPKTHCCLSGGLWNPGTCSSTCVFCAEINSNTITVNFTNTAQSKDVEIHSSSSLCQWNAEESTDWFDITPTLGTSNSIRVTVEDNSNGEYREGDITITQDSITKIITIKQTGSNSNPTGACCQGINCNIKTPLDCQSAGGVFKGEATGCDSNPCDDGGSGGGGGGGGGGSGKDCCDYFIGPCCQYPSECDYITPQGCRNVNGIFLGFNQTCDNCPS